MLTKANSRATVHRPAYLDYIGVKRFGPDGHVTASAGSSASTRPPPTSESPREIPLLRGKVEDVLDRAGVPARQPRRKALLEILETYPRDSLFQIDADELFEIAMGILGLGERSGVRLFVRRDPLDRYVDCLVCIPRDRFNTENRERDRRILLEAFGGEPRRLDAAALRVGARARPLRRPLPDRSPRRATTWPRSRPGSSRPSGPGPTTCATR